MEIILAVMVGVSVVFFGSLITLGNERQRRAIDDIRRQTELWAIQDLCIKRERLACDLKVEDPLGWLNQVVAKVYGEVLHLTVVDVLDEPQVLRCLSKSGIRVLFSTENLLQSKQKKHSRVSGIVITNPAVELSHKMKCVEISILNGGILFDLELQIAWEALTSSNLKHLDKLWMFIDV